MVFYYLWIADEFNIPLKEVLDMPCALSKFYEGYLKMKNKKPEELTATEKKFGGFKT